MDCDLCTTAKELGWWGEANVHHCKECHASWTGGRTLHCCACHRTFGGAGGFDAHRSEGECHDPSTLKREMVPVPHSRFTSTAIWRSPAPEAFT